MERVSKKLIATLIAGLTVAPAANAAFVMKLDDLGDGAPAMVIYDGSGSDLGGPAGVITYSGSVGAFSVNVTTGISKPVVGPAQLDLNSINVSGASGSLLVSITDTDFSGNYAGFNAAYGGTTDGVVDLTFDYDLNNQEFGSNPFASGGHTAAPGDIAFSDDLFGSVALGSPFSLTISALIAHDAAGQVTSFDAAVSPVPVPLPAAFWLFGSALVGYGFHRGFAKHSNPI